MPWFGFGSTQEKFLVLRISPEKVSGFLLALDKERRLSPKKFWPEFDLEKKFGWQRLISQVIIAVDSGSAFTTVVPLDLKRDVPEQPLEAVELENLLAQAIAKIFTQYRQEAGRELETDELDVILAESRVSNFKIDNHQVISPLGFTARKIQAILELTFTKRQIFQSLKNFLSNRQNIFFTELGRSELLAIQKIDSEPFGLVILRPAQTSYFFYRMKTAAGFFVQRKQLNWSTNRLIDSLASAWDIDSLTAQELYEPYLQGKVSPSVSRYFQRVLSQSFKDFLREVKKISLVNRVYVDTSLPFPAVRQPSKSRIVFKEPPLNQIIIDKMGFKLEPTQWPYSVLETFGQLAPFLEFYYDKGGTSINHWLRRRLNWLGSSV